LIICSSIPVFAQVLIALVFGKQLQTDKLAFGLNLIPTYCTISNAEGRVKSGLGLGLYFDIKLSKNFFLHPEAIPKSSLGTEGLAPYPTGNDSLDALFINGSVQRNVKVISVPLLCRYRIKGKLFIEGGPQIDWILKMKDVYKTKVNGNEVTYTTESRDYLTRFDIGMAGGFVYKLKHDKGMGLGLRYFYGLTDIIRTQDRIQANQALYINILIPVGAGKVPEN
jgi:hypothetical protein